jgi:hypothetical protein
LLPQKLYNRAFLSEGGVLPFALAPLVTS